MEDWLKFSYPASKLTTKQTNKSYNPIFALQKHFYIYAKGMQEIIRDFCFLKSDKPHFPEDQRMRKLY